MCRKLGNTLKFVQAFQSQKTQGFCVADLATLSDERRSSSKIFLLFIWIKEPCVRKFEGLARSKLLGISQTDLPLEWQVQVKYISVTSQILSIPKSYTDTFSCCENFFNSLTLFQLGGGGGIHPPPRGFFLAVNTNFMTLSFCSFLYLTFLFYSNKCSGLKNILSVIFLPNIEIKHNYLLTSAFLKRHKILINFSGFCSPDFDNCRTRHLKIF